MRDRGSFDAGLRRRAAAKMGSIRSVANMCCGGIPTLERFLRKWDRSMKSMLKVSLEKVSNQVAQIDSV